MNPKATVIIPTYNRPDLISRAIKSVLSQTYQNFELVIIDDSPNEETEKIVKAFGNPQIKYIRNKIRTNLPSGRNQGVRESSPDSKYIAFLDDDDEFLPLFLQKSIKILEDKKDVAAVITGAEFKSKNGCIIGKYRCDRPSVFWQRTIGNGSIIRKDIFVKENIWYDDKKVCEDLDFGIRLLRNHKWGCLNEILRVYYGYPSPNQDSLSTALSIEEIEGFYEKHYLTYAHLGRKALAFLHFFVGKSFCQSKEIYKGRKNLLKALQIYPSPEHIFYYFIAIFFPKSFQNINLRVLRHKIFKGWFKL